MASVTRGKILRGDLANWDGKTPTATRVDATGGTLTGLAIGHEVDVLQVYGSGTSRTAGTIANAVQSIGTSSATLVFSPGTWTIDTNVTVPSNFYCRIPAGCIFSVDSGKTLTFSGLLSIDKPSAWTSGSGTVVAQTGITGGAYLRTDDESSASVTPTNYQYRPLPVIELERYGLSESASGATNRAALEAAIDVASELGGAILQAPPGSFAIDATVTIDVNSVIIRGVGRATIWTFDPAGTDVLFDFDRGASSSEFCGVVDCQFFSSNSVGKTAIRVDDARTFRASNVLITQTGWLGSASIGINARGRELVYIKECQILCARPVVLGINPNHATIHTDFFVVEDGILGSTETTGTALEFESGVNISNMAINRIAFVLGKWGIKWVDTASTIDSYALSITGCRCEQATDATGFAIELNSTAQDIKQVFVEKFYFDPARGGIKLRKAEDATLKSCSFPGGAGVTNLDVTFQSATQLRLENTFVQALSTATLTNAILESAGIFNTSETLVPKTVSYVYDQGAVVSQKPAFKHNSLKTWSYQGTLANNGTFSTPITRAAYTCAIVKVSAYSTTGPISCGGAAVWTKDGTTTKIGGTANFLTTSVGVELRCLDGGSGLVLVNVLGQSITFAMDVEFV